MKQSSPSDVDNPLRLILPSFFELPIKFMKVELKEAAIRPSVLAHSGEHLILTIAHTLSYTEQDLFVYVKPSIDGFWRMRICKKKSINSLALPFLSPWTIKLGTVSASEKHQTDPNSLIQSPGKSHFFYHPLYVDKR